jgi:hypothetical protein
MKVGQSDTLNYFPAEVIPNTVLCSAWVGGQQVALQLMTIALHRASAPLPLERHLPVKSQNNDAKIKR